MSEFRLDVLPSPESRVEVSDIGNRCLRAAMTTFNDREAMRNLETRVAVMATLKDAVGYTQEEVPTLTCQQPGCETVYTTKELDHLWDRFDLDDSNLNDCALPEA